MHACYMYTYTMIENTSQAESDSYISTCDDHIRRIMVYSVVMRLVYHGVNLPSLFAIISKINFVVGNVTKQ